MIPCFALLGGPSTRGAVEAFSSACASTLEAAEIAQRRPVAAPQDPAAVSCPNCGA